MVITTSFRSPRQRNARGPIAHPRRGSRSGASVRPVACACVAAQRPGTIWSRVKVALAAGLMVAGAVAAIPGLAEWHEPDPAVDYVAGDPGWAHVQHP
ncbi:MAG: hypothetical protein ACK5KO_03430 [Arachnia sp.]